MLIETFIRKLLHLEAHYVTAVRQGPEQAVVEIDRWKSRRLRCGVCRGRCKTVHQVEEARKWRDLSLRRRPLHVLGIDEVSRRKGDHYLTVAAERSAPPQRYP